MEESKSLKQLMLQQHLEHKEQLYSFASMFGPTSFSGVGDNPDEGNKGVLHTKSIDGASTPSPV